MSKKSTLSLEKRAELVLRLLSKVEPVGQIARRAGVSEQTLYRRREVFLNAGKQALARHFTPSYRAQDVTAALDAA